MALFAYRAVDADGRITNGNLDAINAIDLELRLKRLGLDLVTFDAVKRSTARAHAPRHAHRADRLLLPPLAAAEGGREHHRGAHGPARHRGQPRLPPGDREPARGHRGGPQALRGDGEPPVLLRHGVRGAGARRRGERPADRGAGRALREPQVAGRDRLAGQAGAGLSRHRAGGDRRGHLRADDLPRAAARGGLPQHGAEAAARDRVPGGAVRASSCAGGTCCWACRWRSAWAPSSSRETNDDAQRWLAELSLQAPGAGRDPPEDHPRALRDLLRAALPLGHQRARLHPDLREDRRQPRDGGGPAARRAAASPRARASRRRSSRPSSSRRSCCACCAWANRRARWTWRCST